MTKVKVKILGYEYVFSTSQDSTELGGELGRVNHIDHIIHIAHDIGEEERQTTVLHELIHVLNWHLHIDLTEKQVQLLETGLWEFFSRYDKPRLAFADWLFDADAERAEDD